MFRVLVVDDNEDAAATMAMLLELEGYQTQVAHNGAEALRKASEFHPQVVVLDIRMPVMDGIAAAQALRRHVPHVRVVAVSGELPSARPQAEKVFDAMFQKPVEPAELSACIARLIRR